MKPLDHYEFRVQAALDSGQCLDYAEDVSELVEEVKRLRRGITAVQNAYAEHYRLQLDYPKLGLTETRRAFEMAEVAESVLDRALTAMGPGWLPS